MSRLDAQLSHPPVRLIHSLAAGTLWLCFTPGSFLCFTSLAWTHTEKISDEADIASVCQSLTRDVVLRICSKRCVTGGSQLLSLRSLCLLPRLHP